MPQDAKMTCAVIESVRMEATCPVSARMIFAQMGKIVPILLREEFSVRILLVQIQFYVLMRIAQISHVQTIHKNVLIKLGARLLVEMNHAKIIVAILILNDVA